MTESPRSFDASRPAPLYLPQAPAISSGANEPGNAARSPVTWHEVTPGLALSPLSTGSPSANNPARRQLPMAVQLRTMGRPVLVHQAVHMHDEAISKTEIAVQTEPAPQLKVLKGKNLSSNVAANARWGMQETRPAEKVMVEEEDDNDYVKIACCCLHRDKSPRKQIIQFCDHPYFDRVVIAVILANCVTLAMYDPFDPDCLTEKCKTMENIDLAFGAFFTGECVLKILAYGFIGKGAYLSNNWNRMDFVVVLFGLIDFMPFFEGGPLSMARTFRVLRPLRAINRLPSLRILIKLIFQTLPMLGNVVLLCTFLFVVFAIISTSLFMGVLRNRCFSNDDVYYCPPDDCDDPYICSLPEDTGMYKCPPSQRSTYEALLTLYGDLNQTSIKDFSTCRAAGPNPSEGVVSFDNFFASFVAVFIVMTVEGWTEIMYQVQDAYSFWVWIFFFMVIFVGSLVATNLFLCVITAQFSAVKAADKAEQLKKQGELQPVEPGKKGKLSDEAIASASKQRMKIFLASCCFCSKPSPAEQRQQRQRRRSSAVSRRHSQVSVDQHDEEPKEESSPKPKVMLQTLFEDEAPAKVAVGAWGYSDATPGEGETPMAEAAQKSFNSEPFRSTSAVDPIEGEKGDKGEQAGDEEPPASPPVRQIPEIKIIRQVAPYDEAALNDLSVAEVDMPVPVPMAVPVPNPVRSGAAASPGGSQSSAGSGAGTGTGRPSRMSFKRQAVLPIAPSTPLADPPQSTSEGFGGGSGTGRPGSAGPRSSPELKLSPGTAAALDKEMQKPAEGRNVDGITWREPITDNGKNQMEADLDDIVDTESDEEAEEEPIELNVVGQFVEGKFFGNFIMLLIIFNTTLMATEHHSQSAIFDSLQKYGNYVFTGLFALELVLKLIGLPLKLYVADSMNLFDAGIVLSSIVELAMGGGGMLSVLRTFRLMRIFKLVRFMPGLRRQMIVIMGSLVEVSNFCLILLLFIFIYAILGMYLFGAKLQDRSNFDNLYRSFITVFQLLTIEDWPGVMFDAVAHTNWMAVLYFLTLLVSGNYILCNLFVAILLEGFAERAAEEETKIRERIHAQIKKKLRHAFTTGSKYYTFRFWADFVAAGGWEWAESLDASEERPDTAEIIQQEDEAERQKHTDALKPSAVDAAEMGLDKEEYEPGRHPDTEVQQAEASPSNAAHESDNEESDEEGGEKKKELPPKDPCSEGYSLFMFGPENRFRQACGFLVTWPKFDHFILFCIGLNSITMAMERPAIPDDSVERQFIDISGLVMAGVFFVEFSVKVVAWGAYLGERKKDGCGYEKSETAYFRVFWNQLDGFLVLISIIDFLFKYIISVDAGSILDILRILRLLRALRPLRVINRAPKLKQVVNTLILSMGMIGDTILIAMILFLIFGILSVQLFAGKLFFCNMDDASSELDGLQGISNGTMINIVTRQDCESAEGLWDNQNYNYDNLFSALLTLFYVSSLDGWVDVLWYTVDGKAVDLQPEKDYNLAAAMFFVAFLVIANFFILNMFVGIIVDSFQMTQTTDEEHKRLVELKREERRWQKTTERYDYCLKVYRMNFSQWRLKLAEMVESESFDVFITVIICSNVISMMIEHYNQPEYLTLASDILNFIFTGIFFFEAVLKLMVFGATCYFSTSWNQFDFFLVVMSFVGILIEYGGASDVVNPAILRVLRMLRAARMIKLIRMLNGLRILVETTIKSLGQVGNVGLLLFLFFFIYAAAGVEMFGRMACKKELVECTGISEHANFENFFIAMLTLFRIWTGDNGNGILRDAMRTAPDCSDASDCKENCCCTSPIIAIGYFLSFTVIAQFILLNVVIAVLMAQLEESSGDEPPPENADESELVQKPQPPPQTAGTFGSWTSDEFKTTQNLDLGATANFHNTHVTLNEAKEVEPGVTAEPHASAAANATPSGRKL